MHKTQSSRGRLPAAVGRAKGLYRIPAAVGRAKGVYRLPAAVGRAKGVYRLLAAIGHSKGMYLRFGVLFSFTVSMSQTAEVDIFSMPRVNFTCGIRMYIAKD